MENCAKKNYEYMLQKLGKSRNRIVEEGIFSKRTEGRLMSGNPSDQTIAKLVAYYNEHGSALYPHHIEFDDFKYKDLSQFTKPTWKHEQVVGSYIGLFFSRRGTGKPKAMVLTIAENEDHILEAFVIDTVQDPAHASVLISEVFDSRCITRIKQAYLLAKDKRPSLLRGSRLLHGEVSGRGDLMFMHLTDELGTYEMRISTSLKSYLNTYDKVTKKYNWRGGAVIASVCDLNDWPYGMIIGMIRSQYWHPELMTLPDISNALFRMHNYQKKENMLCLQKDIDALWYESFADIHRQSEEREAGKE